jgi:hypothetical protein
MQTMEDLTRSNCAVNRPAESSDFVLTDFRQRYSRHFKWMAKNSAI